MRVAHDAKSTAQGPGTQALVRLGFAAQGLVYVIIGLLAARLAIGDGGATTDRKGALQAIYEQPFGQFLLGVVAVGLLGYAIWSLVLRAALDVEGRGTDGKGVVTRVAFAVIGISYGLLAFGAFKVITGTGGSGKSSDASTQDWTARLLKQSYGEPLVILAGAIIIGVALYRFRVAYKASFMKYFEYLGQTAQTWVRRCGRFGTAAQGFVFAEIGIFLIIAAWKHNAHEAKGMGGSLQQLVHEPYGHALLGIVALGLIAYGIFGLLQARFRHVPSA
jgi:hypothetical protein